MLATIWTCTQEWSLISRRATAFTFATCHQPLSSRSALAREHEWVGVGERGRAAIVVAPAREASGQADAVARRADDEARRQPDRRAGAVAGRGRRRARARAADERLLPVERAGDPRDE